MLVVLPAIALLVYSSVEQRLRAERAVTQNAERLARLASADQERLIDCSSPSRRLASKILEVLG